MQASTQTNQIISEKINISLSIKKTHNKSNNHNTTHAVNTNEMNESIHLQNGFSKICFSDTLFHQTKLAKILEDANVANYVYKDIIEWAIEAQNAKINFSDFKITRDGFLNEIKTLLPWLKSTAPIVKEAILETNTTAPQYIDVTTFDFKHNYKVCSMIKLYLKILKILILI